MIQGFLLILSLLPSLAHAFTYEVKSVRGREAFVLGQGSSHRNAAQAGMTLQEGESVQTGPRTVVFLLSSNGHQIHVGPNSYLALQDAGSDGGAPFNVLGLLQGSVRSIVQKGPGPGVKLEVHHKSASVGVRGTDFLTTVVGEGVEVLLEEGSLYLQNQTALSAGHRATISASGEVLRTASLSSYEFARAIERAGFGSENEDEGGGGAPPSAKKSASSAKDFIAQGDTLHVKQLDLSAAELADLGDGEGALHVAAKNARPELLRLLLAKGADVNGRDHSRKTPLHHAIERKHVPSIKLLLEAGANPKLEDESGRNAFDYARRTGDREIQTLLQR